MLFFYVFTFNKKPLFLSANQFMQRQTCSNCGHIYTDSFCNQCGQKAVHRYTVSHVVHELVHVFTHADKGIFSFAWNIVKKPGSIALDFVEGRRKRHFNLFQYLIIIVGIVTFLIAKTDFFDNTLKNLNAVGNAKLSIRQAQVQQDAMQLFQKYNNIVQMLLIPLFAFWGWLFVTRKKYNYAETVVLHIASSAQTNTLALLTTLFMFWGSSLSAFVYITALSMGIMLYSFTVSYHQFMKLPLWKAFLYSLAVFLCSYILQIILTSIFVAVYVFFLSRK